MVAGFTDFHYRGGYVHCVGDILLAKRRRSGGGRLPYSRHGHENVRVCYVGVHLSRAEHREILSDALHLDLLVPVCHRIKYSAVKQRLCAYRLLLIFIEALQMHEVVQVRNLPVTRCRKVVGILLHIPAIDKILVGQLVEVGLRTAVPGHRTVSVTPIAPAVHNTVPIVLRYAGHRQYRLPYLCEV